MEVLGLSAGKEDCQTRMGIVLPSISSHSCDPCEYLRSADSYYVIVSPQACAATWEVPGICEHGVARRTRTTSDASHVACCCLLTAVRKRPGASFSSSENAVAESVLASRRPKQHHRENACQVCSLMPRVQLEEPRLGRITQ